MVLIRAPMPPSCSSTSSKSLQHAAPNAIECDESPLKFIPMETTSRYASRVESDGNGAVVRVAIYARLSRNPGGLSANTSIQVVECLEEVKHYGREHGLRVENIVIFEENDISASQYSKKKRPDFQSLIELIKENKVDVIFATEVERLVRQPAEAEQLIDLACATNLREVHLTSDEATTC